MTDNPDATANSGASSSDGTENTEHMIPKSRFDDVNNKYKDAIKRLEALEQTQQEQSEAQQKQREKELAEQNRFKELYEQAQGEIEKLKSVQSEVTRYRESFEQTLKTRLDSIPEERKHLVPEFDDPIKLSAWLDKAMSDLITPAKPTAPRIDGGSGSIATDSDGSGKPLSQMQQDLIARAQQTGLSINIDRLRGFNRNPSQQTNLDKKDDTP